VRAISAKWDAAASFDVDTYEDHRTIEAGCLLLNGGKSCYKLINLITENRNSVTGELEQWARGQRKSIARKSASPVDRKAVAIKKLEGELEAELVES
jgi:hypothetical protein